MSSIVLTLQQLEAMVPEEDSRLRSNQLILLTYFPPELEKAPKKAPS